MSSENNTMSAAEVIKNSRFGSRAERDKAYRVLHAVEVLLSHGLLTEADAERITNKAVAKLASSTVRVDIQRYRYRAAFKKTVKEMRVTDYS